MIPATYPSQLTGLAYGCMRITGTWDPASMTPEMEAKGRAALMTAYETGYTIFDHADIYGKRECERLHGRLFHDEPSLRSKTYLATKGGIRYGGDPDPDSLGRYDSRPEYIQSAFDASLERLQVDNVDLYQIHRPDYLMDVDGLGSVLDSFVDSGRAKAIGVSNFLPHELTALQSRMKHPIVANQVEVHWGRLDIYLDGSMHQMAERRIACLVWSPIAGGRYGEGKEPANEKEVALFKVVDAMAAKYGVTRSSLAYAWQMNHPVPTVPIIGTVNPERIRQSWEAMSVKMDREDWYQLWTAAEGKPLK